MEWGANGSPFFWILLIHFFSYMRIKPFLYAVIQLTLCILIFQD